jgi:hypothetical protein
MLNRFAFCVSLFVAGGGPAVLSQLDKLVEPLEKTLTAKLKSDAVKQEVSSSWGCAVFIFSRLALSLALLRC